MVRWRHNVPALEGERLARRMGRTAPPARLGLAQPAAALATAPVDGVAAAPDPGAVADRRGGGWSDRRIARAAPSTLTSHSVGSVYMQAYRLGLHGQPRPEDHEEKPPRPARARAPPSLPRGVPVDDDLGRSGGGARPRVERPLLAICEGRLGIVLAVEASRLVCNGRAFRRGAWGAVVRDGHEGRRVGRPPTRMKTLCAHGRPLRGPSIEILDAARTLRNGGNPLVFPGRREGSSTTRR